MKIIVQKTDAKNTTQFLTDFITTNYINGISLNIAITKDNKIVSFNIPANDQSITKTINQSTLTELKNYEIVELEIILTELERRNITKDIYINLSPIQTGTLTDENIIQVTDRLNNYISLVKNIVENHNSLNLKIHSVNRNLIQIAKSKIKTIPLGFVIYGLDLNFIDVDYYVITMNIFNDAIIDQLLKKEKTVLLYINSDYYLSYVYNHFLGKDSTPYLNETIKKLGIITNYPEITNIVLNKPPIS
ncbi:MAG: hypothetical protein E7168_01955 [Firmicutes bacterium]|nr:hypothetical protein [Bacillota bacterium]